MNEYHKIKNIYERDHNTKKLIEGKFTDLASLMSIVSEEEKSFQIMELV